MPSYRPIVKLSTSAKNSNIVLADIDSIKGSFKTYVSASTMNSTSVNYFADGQIVYVEDSASLYRAKVVPADYENTFVDTVSFQEFQFDSGSFVSASFDGTKTLTLFGNVLSGSNQVSMSVDLSALTGSGAGGDITAVTAGSGISGGGSTGDVTLSINSGSLAGLGILAPVGGAFNIDTGSSHFTTGVQKTDLDGGEV